MVHCRLVPIVGGQPELEGRVLDVDVEVLGGAGLELVEHARGVAVGETGVVRTMWAVRTGRPVAI
ncbi:hypothetical protein GCM10022262_39790 [Georgenia daeguensis]|uniref:Uncharacterized protein n=1 Tax=Georgenia daeguensis TaxID=908355 RepID=A0ABP6UMY2_9MICO